MIVSNEIFMWLVTAVSVGICVGWGARDIYFLVKNLSAKGRAASPDQAVWRDQIFGSVFGLVLICFGLYGVFKYHLNW
ncbi:MAG TPA: hypothetical protein VNO33_15090 [Kofleriaceae bacterium]|nr:hypothetical protein [Kofleriaceae bacterium]